MANPLVFIHVPKTGGMSISRFCRQTKSSGLELYKGKRPHATAIEIRETIGAELFDSATKFAVVRDPMDRYRSACIQGNVRPNSKIAKRLATLSASSVHPRTHKESLLGRQSDMLCIDGELMVDKIFKFEEDLPENVLAWLIEQGYNPAEGAEFPHFHRRNASRKQEPLLAEREEWVREFYAPDYEMFGYE
jgi:hypothetical protein